MASAPPGLSKRAELICSGTLRVSVSDVDSLIRDLSGFDDGPEYFDGLLDYRLRQEAEEIFRPVDGE